MSELAFTSESAPRCLLGVPGCDCDDPWVMPDGTILAPTYCECHDCYVCGEIDCGGHR